MTLHLTPEELAEITGYKKRRDLWMKELTRQGIPFTVRWDRFPLVKRSDYGGSAPSLEQPDFSGLD